MDAARVKLDPHKILHPAKSEGTVFSAAHGTQSNTDHILGHKPSLTKHKRNEVIPSTVSDYNARNPEINKQNDRNYTNAWRLHKVLVKGQQMAKGNKGDT